MASIQKVTHQQHDTAAALVATLLLLPIRLALLMLLGRPMPWVVGLLAQVVMANLMVVRFGYMLAEDPPYETNMVRN